MKTNLLLIPLFITGLSFAQAQPRVGINTNSPLETLDVNGNTNLRGLLKLNNNAGASGQVLTSRGGAENPVWQHTAYTGGGRFFSTYSNNTNATGRQGFATTFGSSTQEDSLDFASTQTTGSDFTVNFSGTTGNHVLINRTGLYHFEGTIRIFATIDADVVMLPRAFVQFKSNNPSPTPDYEFYLQEGLMDRVAGTSVGNSSTFHNLGIHFKLDIHLQQGTTVTFITGMSGLKYPLVAIGVSSGGYVSGQFISE